MKIARQSEAFNKKRKEVVCVKRKKLWTAHLYELEDGRYMYTLKMKSDPNVEIIIRAPPRLFGEILRLLVALQTPPHVETVPVRVTLKGEDDTQGDIKNGD